MIDIQNAILAKDPEQVSATLKKFRDAYQTVASQQ
jgi:hypothetical protein